MCNIAQKFWITSLVLDGKKIWKLAFFWLASYLYEVWMWTAKKQVLMLWKWVCRVWSSFSWLRGLVCSECACVFQINRSSDCCVQVILMMCFGDWTEEEKTCSYFGHSVVRLYVLNFSVIALDAVLSEWLMSHRLWPPGTLDWNLCGYCLWGHQKTEFMWTIHVFDKNWKSVCT
jgi:hypothetical protein